MSVKTARSFFAYPATPVDLKSTIESAVKHANTASKFQIKPWVHMDIFGSFIPDLIRREVAEANTLFADITSTNLNVFYEIGYAIGKGVKVAPVLNSAFANASNEVRKDGLFDNIGYQSYQNSKELGKILLEYPSSILIDLYQKDVNLSQPLFVIDTKAKTDFRNSVISSIKSARTHYRSFDPIESPRISIIQLIGEISSSAGLILPLLATHVTDQEKHNLRCAVAAGIGHGLGREVLLLRQHNVPIERAADFSDMITSIIDEDDANEKIGKFARQATINAQSIPTKAILSRRSELQELSLGAYAAENEFRDLGGYFVETSEYGKVLRGDVSIVAGRKGSGKTAIFFRVRDVVRDKSNSVVIDLKPEAHQLSMFRQELRKAEEVSLYDHTISAFWYYVILTEILITIYRRLVIRSKVESRAVDMLRKIEELFDDFAVAVSGDFTTRLSRMTANIVREIKSGRDSSGRISPETITNIIFRKDIAKLRELICQLTDSYSVIYFLFDNIDKGWTPTGVDTLDIRLVRLLIEATEKVSRDFSANERNFQHVIFLRNDVYELLVEQTPDRGKYSKVGIDWTDRSKLRQVIFKRLQSNENNKSLSFDTLWSKYFPKLIKGKNSFEYFLDHCLMRPRFLINVIELAIANAINRGNESVSESDCTDAVRQHSLTLIDDFGFEIRDVSGLREDLLYSLVGLQQITTGQEIVNRFIADGTSSDQAENALELMKWYGLVGIEDSNGRERYIFDFEYNFLRLQAELRNTSNPDKVLVNPSLFVALTS